MTTIATDGAAAPHANFQRHDRRAFIGGSDARIIMGDDQDALLRLWREKRGEIAQQDLSRNLVVQLGIATEALGRLSKSPKQRGLVRMQGASLRPYAC